MEPASLTIEQIRILKRKAAEDIRDVLLQFHKDAGVCVNSVQLDLVDITTFFDERKNFALGDVRLTLESL